MNFIPLRQEQLDLVKPLLEDARVKMNAVDFTDVSVFIQKLNAMYSGRIGAVYVDSIADPKSIVVLAHWPAIIHMGTLVAVMLIYSSMRGNSTMSKAIHTTIDAYAKSVGANRILGSSWTFRGSKPIDRLWTSNGYEQQEITYVKEIV